MVDFNKLLQGARNYTLHSHTQFCDGRAPMQQMVEAAIALGFTHYGFSPHSPLPFFSSCNMSADAVEPYLNEFQRIKSLYGSRINLFASMEIDYISPDWAPSSPFFKLLPLDYRIGSIHFLDAGSQYVDIDGSPKSFIEKMHTFFHDDIRHVVLDFYKQSIAMVEQGGFDMIGHFDKIGHNASCFKPGIEDTQWYADAVNNLIDVIIHSGIAIEVNTKAWRLDNRFFPHSRYWKRLIDAGATIVINSDAHYPDRIDWGRNEAYELLAKHARNYDVSANL